MSAIVTRLGEFSLPWRQLRGHGATLVTADDTALALGTSKGDWANRPASPGQDIDGNYICTAACSINVPEVTGGKIRTVEIIGFGTDTANQTCAWILYAYRSVYSPVRRVAAGTAILGAMDTVTDPVTGAALTGFYVDTWGLTSDYWGTTIVGELDDAGDAMSVLSFPLRGYQYLYLEIKPTTGTCASFGAAFSGY